MTDPPKGTSKSPPPSNKIQKDIYLIGEKSFDPEAKPSIPYENFSQEHFLPKVLWFQPYSKNLDDVAKAATLGLKIEQEYIDVVIPTPNPLTTICYNNSAYYQGSLPLTVIKPYIPTTAADNAAFMPKRRVPTQNDRANYIVYRDMSRNIVPQFAVNACRAQYTGIYSFEIIENVNNTRNTFTYSGWKFDEPTKIQPESVHMWSSYRTESRTPTNAHNIHLYHTLRGDYGPTPTLMSSENPATFFPY